MKVLVRAIVTGFGLSVGSYVFKKLSQRYGLDPQPTPAPTPPPVTSDGDVARQPS
jgi:hypothetical protein